MATNIFLLTSNHNSQKGILQQKNLLFEIFESLKEFNLIETENIIEGKINIIIECFNDELVDIMISSKEKNKSTKYILFLTEYCTASLLFGFQLNTFTLEKKLLHIYLGFAFKFQNYIKNLIATFKNKPKVYLSINPKSNKKFRYKKNKKPFSKKIYQIRKLIGDIFFFILKIPISPILLFHDQDYLNNSIQLTIREIALDKIKNIFEFCISDCPSVRNSYQNLFFCELISIPSFIDLDRFRNNIKNNYYKGLFFSGRLTEYRKKIIKRNLSKGNHEKITNSIDKPLFSVFKSIKDIDNLVSKPLFEIYIKQEKNWPFSSPMRTILSLEEGFIPINFGKFDDHPINKITLNFDEGINPKRLASIINSKNIEKTISEQYQLIIKYNEKQKKLMPSLIRKFEKISK